MQYLLLTAMLYGATEDYDTAYAALEKYTDIVGREDMRKFNSDTKYIEERYEHELSALRQSKLLWIVMDSCFVFLYSHSGGVNNSAGHARPFAQAQL